uniref:Toxin candidate TRINITY_DN14005_c0_g2_i1 n=1 Tax=Ceriantheomorphe brasiliensis TaxID=1048506 RepID=A0A7G7WZ29_9CNID|nr:toxin candidate TRINITY_DN14005_c0_g2_i1 [Ceriantheomorphe brasiliensis]
MFFQGLFLSLAVHLILISSISSNSSETSKIGKEVTETPRVSKDCTNLETKSCRRWRKRGYCQNLPRRMELYCEMECGLCVKATEKPFVCDPKHKYGCCWNREPVEEGKDCPVCKDKYRTLCGTMVSQCKKGNSKKFMLKNCPVSCGICGKKEKIKLLSNKRLIKG